MRVSSYQLRGDEVCYQRNKLSKVGQTSAIGKLHEEGLDSKVKSGTEVMASGGDIPMCNGTLVPEESMGWAGPAAEDHSAASMVERGN